MIFVIFIGVISVDFFYFSSIKLLQTRQLRVRPQLFEKPSTSSIDTAVSEFPVDYIASSAPEIK